MPGSRGRYVLALVVLLALSSGGCGGQGAAPASSPKQAASPSGRIAEAVPAKQTGAPISQAPRAIVLPNGVRVPVRAVATRANGVLDVPEDVSNAGWWRGGSRIGDPFGVTLIAGHVDSRTQGLGAFVALLGFRPGQQLVVTTKRLRQRFTVSERRLILQSDLTSKPWLYRASGSRQLVLVTCAPPYDPVTGYQQLAVIIAVPAGDAEPRTR